jgi:hypothetical protein
MIVGVQSKHKGINSPLQKEGSFWRPDEIAAQCYCYGLLIDQVYFPRLIRYSSYFVLFVDQNNGWVIGGNQEIPTSVFRAA